MRTYIKNCRVVTPGCEVEKGGILIEDGKIKALFGSGEAEPSADESIDATGLAVLPGFVDVHCHGRNNYDFCDASTEGVNVIGRGKLEEGVTTLLPTTLTLPEQELSSALASIAAYDGKGCKMPAVHLEGPFINPLMTGAQNPAFVRLPDVEEVKRLNAIFPVKKISYAPEQPGGCDFVGQMLNMGVVPSAVHSSAKYSEFHKCYEKGLRNISHFCNQISPLHHRDIGLVGAGLLHDDIYAELICDKLHICPEMIRLVFKVKGADRMMLVSDAMRASGMADGEYDLGGLKVVVGDGAARLKENGALAGSTLKLNVALKNVCEVTGLPLHEAVKSVSLTPATSLGLSGIGRIEPGYSADLVLLDSSFEVRGTFVDGELRYRN